MSEATMLFTGVTLPYHVIDYAIKWARDNESTIRALFLVPGDMPEESYPFPNDLDEAEDINNEIDAERGIRDIVSDEVRYVEKRCSASHVPLHPDVLYSPTLQQVLSHIKDSEVIFVDKNIHENDDDTNNLDFNIQDIKTRSKSRFVPVGEYDKYSDTLR